MDVDRCGLGGRSAEDRWLCVRRDTNVHAATTYRYPGPAHGYPCATDGHAIPYGYTPADGYSSADGHATADGYLCATDGYSCATDGHAIPYGYAAADRHAIAYAHAVPYGDACAYEYANPLTANDSRSGRRATTVAAKTLHELPRHSSRREHRPQAGRHRPEL